MANELVLAATVNDLSQIERGRYWHTFDAKDRRSQLLVAKAVQREVPSIMEAVNTVLEIDNLLFHVIRKVREDTGEIVALPRLVIYCKDGSMYSTSGEKAIRDVLFPAAAFGFELPYKPAQKFKVLRVASKSVKDRYYASLEWQG